MSNGLKIRFTRTLVRSPVIVYACMALFLGSCGLPANGPYGEKIETSAIAHVRPPTLNDTSYCIVDMSPSVVAILNQQQHRLAGRLADPKPPALTVEIGTGDVVSVTLFEAGVGGLFFPENGIRTGNFLTIPNQIVDIKGNITIPYAGQIKASGRTAPEIQDRIVASLNKRALDPQAVVTVVERRNSLISVFGKVNSPQRMPANESGERLLDVIARAGGIKDEGEEAWILVERRGAIAIAPFGVVIHDPINNIPVGPLDTIYVFKEAQTFLAFGATSTQGQIPFGQWRLSLAEAIAKAGGLLDEKAEPGWAFLFRSEAREIARQYGTECTGGPHDRVVVIYRSNLREPIQLYWATEIMMKNKDIIYVANARSVEINKLLQFVQAVNQTVIQIPLQDLSALKALKIIP